MSRFQVWQRTQGDAEAWQVLAEKVEQGEALEALKANGK
jgi:hypothetical protein